MILSRDNGFNIYYVISLLLLVVIPAILILILKNKSDKTKKIVLWSLALSNFLLHFLKILHPDYQVDIEDSLRRMTAENICALTTIVLPFTMLSKNKTLKGYFYLIGLLGGLMAVILTTEPNNRPFYEFNSIRYYICHYILFAVPVVSVALKEYKPDFRSSIWMPLMFLMGQTIIMLNEFFVWGVGLYDYSWETFLSPIYRNPSFVFGPNTEFKHIADAFGFLVPEIFKTNIFGVEVAGDYFYWPVVWLIIPVVLFFPLVYFLFTLPFTHKDVAEFIKNIKNKKSINIEQK